MKKLFDHYKIKYYMNNLGKFFILFQIHEYTKNNRFGDC